MRFIITFVVVFVAVLSADFIGAFPTNSKERHHRMDPYAGISTLGKKDVTSDEERDRVNDYYQKMAEMRSLFGKRMDPYAVSGSFGKRMDPFAMPGTFGKRMDPYAMGGSIGKRDHDDEHGDKKRGIDSFMMHA